MVRRIRMRSVIFLFLLISLLTGAGSAETVLVDNFADLKSNLSSGGEKTLILTDDIIAESSISVKGKVTLTTEENTNHAISFAEAPADSTGFFLVEDGTVFVISGNKSGTLSIFGKTSEHTSLIFVQSGELHLRNTILTQNHLTGTESTGGAVSASGGKVFLSGCTISDCSADLGGAVYLLSGKDAAVLGDISDTALIDCSASFGGGIYADYSGDLSEYTIPQYPQTKLSVAASSIVGCSAESNGGGIYAVGSDVVLTSVNFADSAVFGKFGSIYAESSLLTLSGPQDWISVICLDKAVIFLEDNFSTSEHITVELTSQTAASSYIMKIDKGEIGDVLGYFTFDLPYGFLTEKNGKSLTLFVYVSFDANGGVGTPLLSEIKCAVPDTLPICPYTRAGYSFAGWAVTPNGAARYENAGLVTIFEPTTLYAVWINESAGPSYYRTITSGGLVEFGGLSPLRYIDLPSGASGDLFFSDAPEILDTDDMDIYSVFRLEITEYPAEEVTDIEFVISEEKLSSAGALPTDICLYQYEDNVWKPLPTSFSVEGKNVVFDSSSVGLGTFAVVFNGHSASAAETPLGFFGILAGFGTAYLLRRR